MFLGIAVMIVVVGLCVMYEYCSVSFQYFVLLHLVITSVPETTFFSVGKR